MRKYKYIIRYNYDAEFKNFYCTDSFLKFFVKFLLLKHKFWLIEIEYNKPEA